MSQATQAIDRNKNALCFHFSVINFIIKDLGNKKNNPKMSVIMRHFEVILEFISQETVDKKKVWFVKVWEPLPCGVELSSSCRTIECVHSRPFDMSQQVSHSCINDSCTAPL